MINLSLQRHALLALLAAALFGASPPLAKLLVGELSPMLLAGGVLLSHDEHGAWGFSPHAVAVLAACVLWGLDNNLTRHISSGDAVVIAMIKGLVAGGINLVLGLVLGYTLPSWGPIAAALGLGAASYGASLVLYVLALRHLGSARTAAHFGTAPFIGAGLSVLLLGEPLTVMLLVAVALMAVASWLVLTERHAHEHGHELLQHVHEHVHDEHHQHIHGEETDVGPHTHAHSHAPLQHSHAHLPDIHHRHGHQ